MFKLKADILLSGLAAALFTGVAYADIPRHTCSDPNITPTTPSAGFTVIGEGDVVRHERTSLEWQRCALGQSWNGAEARCDGSVQGYGWQEALQEAESLDGWRLPDLKELRSIVEQCTREPAINTQVFPDTPSFRFWSSSPVAMVPTRAWLVHFNAGHNLHDSDKSKDNHPHTVAVRLVRDGL